jgi:hypothetical protein
MKELWISDLHLSAIPERKEQSKSFWASKPLAIASVTLNRSLVIDGIELYRTKKGPALRFPKLSWFPAVYLGSELFRKHLLHRVWQTFLYEGKNQ